MDDRKAKLNDGLSKNIKEMLLSIPSTDVEWNEYSGFAFKVVELTKQVIEETLKYKSDANERRKEVFRIKFSLDVTRNKIEDRLKAQGDRFYKNSFSDEKTVSNEVLAAKFLVSRQTICNDLNKRHITYRLKKRYIEAFNDLFEKKQKEFINFMFWGILKAFNKDFSSYILYLVGDNFENDVKDRIETELKKYNYQVVKNRNLFYQFFQNIEFPGEVDDREEWFYEQETNVRGNFTEDFNIRGQNVTLKYDSEYVEKGFIQSVIDEIDKMYDNFSIKDIKTQPGLGIRNGLEYEYTPDLMLLIHDKKNNQNKVVLVELKPWGLNMFDSDVLSKYSAMEKFCKDKKIGAALIMVRYDKTQKLTQLIGLKCLKKEKANIAHVKRFIDFVHEQCIVCWEDYKAFMNQCKELHEEITFAELLKALNENKHIALRNVYLGKKKLKDKERYEKFRIVDQNFTILKRIKNNFVYKEDKTLTALMEQINDTLGIKLFNNRDKIRQMVPFDWLEEHGTLIKINGKSIISQDCKLDIYYKNKKGCGLIFGKDTQKYIVDNLYDIANYYVKNKLKM